MGEAEIEGDLGDGDIRRSLREPGVQSSEAHVEQHLRDRYAEVAAEAELERADADPGRAGELRQVERLTGIFRKMIPRGAQCTRQTLGLPREPEE